LLLGAELLAVLDTVGGTAVARFLHPRHGHLHLRGECFGGRLVAGETDSGFEGERDARRGGRPSLGRVTEVVDIDDGAALIGRFGWLTLPRSATVRMLDHWAGEFDDSSSIAGAGEPVAGMRAAASVVAHPQAQVLVSRRGAGGSSAVELTARRALACERTRGDATVFASDDLTLRMLEHGGLLVHPTVPGEPPTEQTPVDGDAVTVHIVVSSDDGVVSGDVTTWLECGRTGWVVVVDERGRRPMRVTAMAERLLASLFPTSAVPETATAGEVPA
jgi:hypothetical protein